VTQFLSLLISGVSLGAIYALIALGFVVIFKSSEVVSFMHGSLLLLGAYLVVKLQNPLGFWLGCLAAIALTGLLGLLIDRVLLSRCGARR
jgi:branched-chain amino acid transport system permease protein